MITPDEIIFYLNNEFPSLAFQYLKRDFKNKEVFEFFYSGMYESSILFDMLVLSNNENPFIIVKNAIISSIKRNRIQEKEETIEEDNDGEIKRIWSKYKDK